MSIKTRRRLVILILALIVFSGLFFLKSQSFPLFQPEVHLAYKNVTSSDVHEVIISTDQSSSDIKEKNGQWYVTKNKVDFPADSERVNEIIKALLSVKKTNPVSRNRTNQSEFGIGKDKITFKTGSKSYTAFIGSTTNQSSNFIRFDDENDVYIAEGLSSAFFPDDYRDLSLHLLSDEESAIKIHELNENSEWLLEKKNDTWLLSNEQTGKDKISFFLNDIKTLKATSLEDSAAIDVSLLEKTLTLEIEEANTHKTADFYKYDDTLSYVKVSGMNILYKVPTDDVTSLIKNPEDLI
jgi:hypothetical protein